MPIVKFDLQDIPAGFSTKTEFFKITNENGHFTLIDMTCPHRGGPLTHGRCNGETIVCPWHHGKHRLRKVIRRTKPAVTTPEQVIFIVNSKVETLFYNLPIDEWELP